VLLCRKMWTCNYCPAAVVLIGFSVSGIVLQFLELNYRFLLNVIIIVRSWTLFDAVSKVKLSHTRHIRTGVSRGIVPLILKLGTRRR
jgi:hypothetical protein